MTNPSDAAQVSVDDQVRIKHPDTDGTAVIMRESLPVYLELGWAEVEDEEPQQNIPSGARSQGAPVTPQNPPPAV